MELSGGRATRLTEGLRAFRPQPKDVPHPNRLPSTETGQVQSEEIRTALALGNQPPAPGTALDNIAIALERWVNTLARARKAR
jgi:hypothetical protein